MSGSRTKKSARADRGNLCLRNLAPGTLDRMAVRMAVAVRVRHAFGRRHIDDMAVAHAALGDHLVGERLHLGAAALQHRHLETAFLVEMHVQRGLRQIVVVVEFLGETLGQFAGVMVVHIDQRGDAVARARHLDGSLLEA